MTRIVTDWKRFPCGLWRLKRGDISAAYCADTFPKLKVFVHEGKSFTNCGNLFSGPIQTTATCYPLIPFDKYQGPDKVQYSYEGEEGHFLGKRFRLGKKVLFTASDPTVDEWTRLLRILYADGGMFAHGVTYAEFLSERHPPRSPNERVAHAAELGLCESSHMPETQDAMRIFIDLDLTPKPISQFEFAL